jgi:7-cyano-7-deazaguanine synthase
MTHSLPPAAVLISGGLDSAVLLGETLRERSAVWPLYVRTGLAWESAELTHLHRFLEAVNGPALRPLHILDLPVTDLYGQHWSITGQQVPDADSPDEAVFLPGRNVLLLAKALLWCHLNRVDVLLLGLLRGNPFPDATASFFTAYVAAVNQAVEGRVRVQRPFAELSKRQVLERAGNLPLELSFSCIRPIHDRHCGQCNKCAERRRAFADLGRADGTAYASEGTCTA